MEIEVNLFASLAQYKPEDSGMDSWVVTCQNGMSVSELLSQIKLPAEEVKLIFINGVHGSSSTILNHGDRVGIFPPVGGG